MHFYYPDKLFLIPFMQRLMCRSLYAQEVAEEEILINESIWKLTYRMQLGMQLGIANDKFVAIYEFTLYDNIYNVKETITKKYKLSVVAARVWDTQTLLAFMDVADAMQLDHELMSLRHPSFFLAESFSSQIQVHVGPRGFMLPLYGILRVLRQQNWNIPNFNPYLKLGGIMLSYRVHFVHAEDLIKLEFLVHYDAYTTFVGGAEERKVETYSVTFSYELFNTMETFQQYNKVMNDMATYLYTFSGFTRANKVLLEQDWFSKEEDSEEGKTDNSLDNFELDLNSF